MDSNLELWNKVESTDPKYTKKANVKGNKITSIAPQYQLLNATNQFGPYGKGFGFKSIELDYSLYESGLIVFKGVFFYPDGEFPIINSISLFKDNAKTKIDDDFAKKVETDALTKALSKLGFNADIFMGLFDDCKYVEEMNAKFKEDHPALGMIKQAVETRDIDYIRNNWSGCIAEAWPTLPIELTNALNEAIK